VWEIKAETAKLEKTEEVRIAPTKMHCNGISKNDASRVKEGERRITALEAHSVKRLS
jgi:hypothetical protein